MVHKAAVHANDYLHQSVGNVAVTLTTRQGNTSKCGRADLRGGTPLVSFNHVIDPHFVTFSSSLYTTSCARGDTVCLRPLQVDNIFAFIRQVAPVPACWLK